MKGGLLLRWPPGKQGVAELKENKEERLCSCGTRIQEEWEYCPACGKPIKKQD